MRAKVNIKASSTHKALVDSATKTITATATTKIPGICLSSKRAVK